jgi:hypothetical protein
MRFRQSQSTSDKSIAKVQLSGKTYRELALSEMASTDTIVAVPQI